MLSARAVPPLRGRSQNSVRRQVHPRRASGLVSGLKSTLGLLRPFPFRPIRLSHMELTLEAAFWPKRSAATASTTDENRAGQQRVKRQEAPSACVVIDPGVPFSLGVRRSSGAPEFKTVGCVVQPLESPEGSLVDILGGLRGPRPHGDRNGPATVWRCVMSIQGEYCCLCIGSVVRPSPFFRGRLACGATPICGEWDAAIGRR